MVSGPTVRRTLCPYLRRRHASLGRGGCWRLFVVAVATLVARQGQIGASPLLIAHRGSPCSHPDETIASFAEAIEAGVDYIEVDVVRTKDGHLVCRHDVTLDASTDVTQRPEFAGRSAWRLLPDGRNVSGVFAADLTLAEVKALRAVQPLPFRDHQLDRQYSVPTLSEVIALAKDSAAAGKPVGLYIEVKEPLLHEALGLPLEGHLVQALVEGRVAEAGVKVILQSFDREALRTLGTAAEEAGLPPPPLVWLLGCGANVSEWELDEFKEAGGGGIGPHKHLLLPVQPTPECDAPDPCAAVAREQQCTGRIAAGALNEAGALEERPQLLEWAQQRALVVHAYTFRNENRFMALDFHGDAHAELDLFAAPDKGLAVDGVFVDCAATAVQWRKGLPPSTPHENVAKEQAQLEEQQHMAPPLVISVVVVGMVGLVLGIVVGAARWLVRARGARTYQVLDTEEGLDVELPLSRRLPLPLPPDSPTSRGNGRDALHSA